MRFLTKELAWAMDDPNNSKSRDARLLKKYFALLKRYQKHLDSIRHRLSKPAYRFFRYGFAETGLHDARLLRLSIGDGLDFHPSGTNPFYLNKQVAFVRFEFLNYEQCFHYVFTCEKVRRIRCDIETRRSPKGWHIGDLYSYEVFSLDRDFLNLSFLFAEGGTVDVEFRNLVFRRTGVKRRYSVNEIYR